jgi:hypothetical protein
MSDRTATAIPQSGQQTARLTRRRHQKRAADPTLRRPLRTHRARSSSGSPSSDATPLAPMVNVPSDISIRELWHGSIGLDHPIHHRHRQLGRRQPNSPHRISAVCPPISRARPGGSSESVCRVANLRLTSRPPKIENIKHSPRYSWETIRKYGACTRERRALPFRRESTAYSPAGPRIAQCKPRALGNPAVSAGNFPFLSRCSPQWHPPIGVDCHSARGRSDVGWEKLTLGQSLSPLLTCKMDRLIPESLD